MFLKKTLAVLTTVFFSTTLGLASAAASTPAVASTDEISGAIEGGATVFDTEQTELTILPATESQLSEDELNFLAPTISCNLNVQNVHPSSHFSGTINGVATIGCTSAAGKLTLHYSLIRVSPNPTQWGGPSVTNTGQSWIQTNRAVDCNQGPGTFRGWAQGVIAPPPGYQLVGPATSSKYGNSTSVLCGATLLTPENKAAEISETLTVTFVRSDLAS